MARRIWIIRGYITETYQVQETDEETLEPLFDDDGNPIMKDAYREVKVPISEEDFVAAKANNCPEIAQGIPPALINIVRKDMLPCAYEEPESAPLEPPRDLEAEIDDIVVRISKLEAVKL